jgi:serine/threonine-protein kinase
VDVRADIYGWGVVAYELMTGRHPFAACTSAQAMVAAHLSEVAPSVAARAADVPSALADLIDRALRKDPAARPPNASALVHMLNDVAASGTRLGHARRGPLTASRRWVGVVGVGVAVAAVAAGVWWTRSIDRTAASTGAQSVRSIAVLPFIDARADSGTAYLGSGMADALTTTLAKLPELRVVANRSSATAGRTVDASEAGKALNVEAVLEGSVTRLGDRLRIRAHLVRVADGTILWGETYDRTASNMFELEDEVTRTIAGELRGSLASERGLSGSALARGTEDQEAYDLYLRGRHAWSKRGEQGLRAAIDLFNAALTRDPGFARAHAGLAMAWVVIPVFTTSVSADSALTMAQQSGNRALALDSALADAHLAIAYAHKMKWRWEEAERHFRITVALAPEDATAHHWYGVHLYAVGDVTRSADELRRARELDPFATTIAIDGANALYGARRYDDARTEIRRGFTLDSMRADFWWMQGLIQLAQGRADSAVSSFETARRIGIVFDMRSYLSVALRTAGRVREADTRYAEVRRDYIAGRVSAYDYAVAAVGANDSAAALAAVQRIVERREFLVTEVSFPCDPLFDPLRSNPRFGRLLASAGMRCEGLPFRTK